LKKTPNFTAQEGLLLCLPKHAAGPELKVMNPARALEHYLFKIYFWRININICFTVNDFNLSENNRMNSIKKSIFGVS
jgi:hypothetical protein